MTSDGHESSLTWRNRAILMLWAAAILLIVVQWLALRTVASEYRAHAGGAPGIFRVPADWWRGMGVFLPLLLIGIALWLQRRWRSTLLRRCSKVGFYLLIPVTIVAVLVALAWGPESIDSVTLPSGTRFVLAIEPVTTDTVYSLYQPMGRLGLWWRQIGNLDYSEDGRFTGGEKIVVSADRKWLLVARAGVWTDCFRLVGETPVDCGVQLQHDWSDPRYEAAMHARSAEIQRLTGMGPPRAS